MANSEQLPIRGAGPLKTIRSMDMLLAATVPPVEDILYPVIQLPGITMISGEKGVGKTFLSLAIALSVASGSDVFGWRCRAPRRVLFIDAELPLPVLQLRIRQVCAALGIHDFPTSLSFWSASDQYPLPKPNLASSKDGAALVSQCRQFDLVIFDNLSAMIRGVDLNTAQGWEAIEDFVLSLRHEHTSVVLVQHLGKDLARGPRGTSKQEDVLDVSLVLKKAANAKGSATITVTCRKMRNCAESEFTPLEVELGQMNGKFSMVHRPLIAAKTELIIQRYKDYEADGRNKRGCLTKIAKELCVSPSQVTKAVQKYKRSIRDS